MSVHKLSATRAVDPVREAKIHLAAAHRLAVLDELEEGIDNHTSRSPCRGAATAT